MAHMELLFEGGISGRYHRAGRLRQLDKRSIKRAIDELTSSNYTIQELFKKQEMGIRDIEKRKEALGRYWGIQ